MVWHLHPQDGEIQQLVGGFGVVGLPIPRTQCSVILASLACATVMWHLHPQDGEIQQLLAARAREAGAEGQLHERLNFVAFKYQLLVDMVGITACPPPQKALQVQSCPPAYVKSVPTSPDQNVGGRLRVGALGATSSACASGFII